MRQRLSVNSTHRSTSSVKTVLRWVLSTVWRYLLTFLGCWVVIAVASPADKLLPESASTWDSAVTYVDLATAMLVFIACPSILIVLVLGVSSLRSNWPKLRMLACGLLLLPLWPLLFVSQTQPLLFQAVAQVVFSLWLMPRLPLLDQVGVSR
ncbi:hypothetical protein ACWEIK_23980 [Streptomyces sp. NPDC004673]